MYEPRTESESCINSASVGIDCNHIHITHMHMSMVLILRLLLFTITSGHAAVNILYDEVLATCSVLCDFLWKCHAREQQHCSIYHISHSVKVDVISVRARIME